ncbi:hypothetical protein E2562_019871 [Oryza meyeriana var. granulata]|uniref:Uncharacterized protein n=1 Tax=Oryza meyeriana var. granulata TaxID=110450 RepID=A0A6G1EXC6_9ORYZ|nr:hypothetical protein E2562_019871 [Oryza meyeriana var. granulata]
MTPAHPSPAQSAPPTASPVPAALFPGASCFADDLLRRRLIHTAPWRRLSSSAPPTPPCSSLSAGEACAIRDRSTPRRTGEFLL